MPTDHDLRGPRRDAIRAILRRHRVPSQAALVARLRARGFTVTQSSVSRDLRQLGATKQDGRYGLAEPGPDRAEDFRAVAPFVRKAVAAGPHLTVVTTAVGAAQSVALAVDRAAWPEVVGTVAGDDTLFVATAGAREQRRLLRRFEKIVVW